MRPPLLASLACALLATSIALPSLAGETRTLHLRDGTTVTGEIIEQVQYDHFLVRLAPGVEARVEWSALSEASRAEWAPVTPAPPPSNAVAPSPVDPASTSTASWSGADTSSSGDSSWSEDRFADPRRVSLGVRTGYPSPFGYLGFTATYFPFDVGAVPLRIALGLELTLSPALGFEPLTFSQMLLAELGVRRAGLGIGLGIAESALKPVVAGDDPGVAMTLVAHVLHLRVNPTRELGLRLAWGAAVIVGAPYCDTHPSACPQLAQSDDPFSYFIDLTASWTFDFGPRRRSHGSSRLNMP